MLIPVPEDHIIWVKRCKEKIGIKNKRKRANFDKLALRLLKNCNKFWSAKNQFILY